MILSCQNITKLYGTNTILENVSFHIEKKDKLAIVGINGAGKSTLLKIILELENADEGQVIISKDTTIGYLSQHQDISFNNTVYAEMLETKKYIIDLENNIRELEKRMKNVSGEELDQLLDSYNRLTSKYDLENGYAYESEITGVLKGLGFEKSDYDREINTLSGGQKMRIALGRLLLTKPDIIILDEPTNHLDMNSIAWLETFLSSYQGSVVIVSHDRYFIDKISNKILEIDNTKATLYNGNYSYYVSKRTEIKANEIKAYNKQQEEIKHQEAVITKLKQFNREKSIKRAESREKLLDKIERIDRPTEVNSEIRLKLEPSTESGNDVLTVENLSKSFDSNELFSDLSFEIKRGEHVALIGGNGTGKTTILKIINRVISKDSGTIVLGSRVKIGYYDQEHQVLSLHKTIFEEISDAYPSMTNTQIRNTLAAFLFTSDDVFKRISDLSGGERGRVSLAKLMLSPANFLILDEPTNHLDIQSKEILENALKLYTGTILFVSHDRYFINKVSTRILDLKDKAVTSFIGNYDYYDSHKDIIYGKSNNQGDSPFTSISGTNGNSGANNSISMSVNITTLNKVGRNETNGNVTGENEGCDNSYLSNKDKYMLEKEEQARLRKRASTISTAEADIEDLEAQIAVIDADLYAPENSTNSLKLSELSLKRVECQASLDVLYELWDSLNEE